MPNQTSGMRVNKHTRDLADKIAIKISKTNAASLSMGTYSVSQGHVVQVALEEFVVNHPELGIE